MNFIELDKQRLNNYERNTLIHLQIIMYFVYVYINGVVKVYNNIYTFLL